MIFIGVSDKNNIKGIKIGKETLNQWKNQISQIPDPRKITELEEIKVDGKTVIAVKIKEKPIKSVSTKGKCLKRVDSSNHAIWGHNGGIMGPKKQDIDNMVIVNYTKFNGIEAEDVLHGEYMLMKDD